MQQWRRQWHPTPVLLLGKSHGWRSLVGCSPWGHYELDTTERLHFHFSLSCIGEGNGNPLQCSCLENPRAGGAWWAAVYGVTQSRTRLKRLSTAAAYMQQRWKKKNSASGTLLSSEIIPKYLTFMSSESKKENSKNMVQEKCLKKSWLKTSNLANNKPKNSRSSQNSK